MKSLEGIKLVNTRAESGSDELTERLSAMGARVIAASFIEVVKLDADYATKEIINNLSSFDHLVFTSKNGVEYFWELLNDAGVCVPETLKVFSLGDKSSSSMQGKFARPVIFDGVRTSADLAKVLKEKVLQPQHRVLFVTGQLTDKSFENVVGLHCQISRLDVYKTVRPTQLSATLDELQANGFDGIIFSSPSAINFSVSDARFKDIISRKPILCIGSTTARTLERHGLFPSLVSSSPQPSVFASEIEVFFNDKISRQK